MLLNSKQLLTLQHCAAQQPDIDNVPSESNGIEKK
jgi:hypothetical protein